MKRNLLLGIAAAAAASAPVFFHAPAAQAACIGSNPPCTFFATNLAASPNDVASFSGTGTSGVTYTCAKLYFYGTGITTSFPISLSNIALKGNGLGSYTAPSPSTLQLTATTSGFGAAVFSNDITLDGAGILGQNIDFSSNLLKFDIPAGVGAAGAKIYVGLQYLNSSGSQIATSLAEAEFTAQDPPPPAPGPLPLLGAGAAFGFSRQIRRRVKAAA